MDLSVIIPTRGRAHKLAACLARLARQSLPHARLEVLVGFDGPDPSARDAAAAAWAAAGAPPASLTLLDCPREGYNSARNRLLALARGRILLSLNDDVLPDPRLAETHLREHDAAAAALRRSAIIAGHSPFLPGETLFDLLARDTSLIFFYHHMLVAPRDPLHDWGFRHCYGLNFSAPLAALRECGGFTSFPLMYGYDDIEIAFRLRALFDMPMLFRPAALAPHDHRYTPRELLDREFRLGYSAWLFAQRHPAFTRALFDRDITSPDELAYSREFTSRELPAAERIRDSFLRLADIPADALAPAHAPRLTELIYQHHLPLKRWTWRRGLLAAADGLPCDPAIPGAAPPPATPAPHPSDAGAPPSRSEQSPPRRSPPPSRPPPRSASPTA